MDVFSYDRHLKREDFMGKAEVTVSKASEKLKAVETAMSQIERQFGKGTMR